MRLVLSTRRAAFSWRRCEAIRCRLPYNVNQSRSFSQTLPLLQVDTTLKAQPSAATNDLLQDAFSMETMESYMKARKTLSHEDATAQYKTRMLGPLSTLDLEVQERLRRINSKPDELLRQCVKNSTVSPHVISLCLSAQYQRADKVPRKNRYELLAEQKDEGLARLVLSTLWNDEKLWTPLVVADADAIFHLCYYAILESLEEMVIQWSFVAITEQGSPLAGSGPHNAWRGQLLGHLITAHSFIDTANCADDMLLCMHRIVEESKAVCASQAALVSLHQPRLRCQKLLRIKIGSKTNGQLFDSFVKWVGEHANAGPLDRLFQTANLSLYHPQTPTEAPALEFLLKWNGHRSMNLPKETEHHNRFLQRTFDVAVEHGNLRDAEWIKAKFRDRLDPQTDRFAPPTRREIGLCKLEAQKKKKKTEPRREHHPSAVEDRPVIRYV